MKNLVCLFVAVMIFISFNLALASTYTFSDKNYLGGNSWGTMVLKDVFSVNLNTMILKVTFTMSDYVPDDAKVTGFGFGSILTPYSVNSCSDLDWILLRNMNAIPNPNNGDEFIPNVTKNDYTFGVTAGNSNNFNPPGLEKNQSDIFEVLFTGNFLTETEFVNNIRLTGIRLQSLPDDINGGSLFLTGNSTPVPISTTILLLSSGLFGLVVIKRRTSQI